MKTNGSLIGGRLIDDPRIYAAYARYFVKFIQAYQRAGVPVDAVTVQNEPQNRHPSGYPGTDMPVGQEAKLINALGPRCARGPAHEDPRLRPQLVRAPERHRVHAAGRGPRDRLPVRPAGASAAPLDRRHRVPLLLRRPEPRRPRCTTRSRTRRSGSPSARARTAPTDPPAQVFSDTLKWHARNLVLGATRNWAKTVVNWNLALDPSGGPHNGGCDTCTGVVTVDPDGTVTRDAEYYTLGHLARFVRPGAVRIASTSFGTTGWNGQIMDVAFRNPDGSTALVVHNENDNPRTLRRRAGRPLLRLHAARRRAGDVHLACLQGARQRAARCCPPTDDRHRNAARARRAGRGQSRRRRRQHPLDDRHGSAAGQTLQVDSRHRLAGPPARPRHRTGTGDYPRGYAAVDAASTGRPGPLGDGQRRRQLTSIDAPGRSGPLRAHRLDRQPPPQWWSVADLRIYR